MLDFLRRKAQSTYIQITILIIILVFIFWGVGTNQGGGSNAVATVNGENISSRQYQQAYEQTVNQYQAQLGGVIPPGLFETLNLKQQVVDQLIQELIIRQGAKEAGLIVGSDEVRKVVHGMSAFTEKGAFSLELYKKMLASSRMTPADFENSIRNDILRKKIADHLTRFAGVSELELKDRFAFDHEQIRLEYAVFTPDAFRASGPVAEPELSGFFNAHKQNYLNEPQIKLRYLLFSGEQARQEAGTAYEGIIQAGSLDKYAGGGKTPVLSSDYFTQANPPQALAGQPELVSALFALKKGELSSILETKGGYAIFYVDEAKAPQTPPLAEVKARVEKDFLADQAKNRAREAAGALLEQAKKGGPFAPAEAGKGTVQTTAFFARNQPEAGGLPGQVAAQGRKLSVATPYPAEIIEHNGAFYALHFKESSPAGDEAFAGQKETLGKLLLQEKQMQLLDSWVSYLQSRAKITTNQKLLGL